MKRAKVIKRSKKILLQDDILNSFNEMVGSDKPEPVIAIDRYDQYSQHLYSILTVMRLMGGKVGDTKLVAFVDHHMPMIECTPPPPNPATVLPEGVSHIEYLMYKYDPLLISDIFLDLKNSNLVKVMILTLNDISQHDSLMQMHEEWILRGNFHELRLFSEISDFDIYDFCINAKHDFVQYVHTAINIIYKNLRSLYMLYSTPDIDMEKMTEMLMVAIKELKKHVPRCEKAFKAIERYAYMLQNKFGEYYRDFQQSGSKTIILENFIADVAKEVESDTQTATQFRKVINFIRKQVAAQGGKSGGGRKMDPRLQSILNMAEMNYGDDKKDADADDADDESTPAADDEEEPEEIVMGN